MVISLWTTNQISLIIGKLDDNMILYINNSLLPQLMARPRLYNNAMHLAREFIGVFNTNTANKIFQSDGTTEIEDDEEKAKQIARWVNYYKREEEKKAAKRKAESEVNESQKVHLDDGMSGLLPPVPSAATDASNNFIATNTELSNEGMDMGGLQLQSEMMDQQQQRESPTSALDFDHAGASIKSLALADDKVGTMGNLISSGTATIHSANHQPYLPEKRRRDFDNYLNNMPFSPGKPTGESGGGVSSTDIVSQSQLTQLEYSTDRKFVDIVQELKAMKLKTNELEAKVAKFDELEAEVDKLKAEIKGSKKE